MKSIIILLALISACYAGHICVGEITLKYQNVDFFKGAWIPFMLESGISSSDYIQITWPFDFGSTSVSSTFTTTPPTSFIQGADGTKIYFDSTGSTNVVKIKPASALAANQWYTITLMLGGSPTAKLYKNPIQIQTQSQSSTTDAVIYDENLSAGQISIIATPATIADVQVTTDTTKQVDVSATASNKVLGTAPYTVYIDVLPLADYHKGGYISYKVSGDFTFGTSCTVLANSCPLATADATCRNATLAGGSCVQDTSDTLKQTLMASYNSIYKAQAADIKTYYRISTTVQNPVYYDATGSGIKVYITSKTAYRYYEKYEGGSNLFTTSQITITDKKYTIFWGLLPDVTNALSTSATSWGCPVSLYKAVGASDKLKAYNKIAFYFSSGVAFPTSTLVQYAVSVKITATNAPTIAKSTIASNMPTLPSGSKLACTTTASTPFTIDCTNVGALSAATYWFAVSVAFSNTVVYGNLANFGGIKFTQKKVSAVDGSAGSALALTGDYTAGTTVAQTQLLLNEDFENLIYGSEAVFKTKVGFNYIFDGETQFDLTATKANQQTNYQTAVTKAIGKTASQVEGRSAVKYRATAFDLFILLNPTLDQVCSSVGTAATTNSVITETLAGPTNYCGAVAGTNLAGNNLLTETVVNIIANPNVLNLDSIKMKGVYIAPGSGFLSTGTEDTIAGSWCAQTKGCGPYNGGTLSSNTYDTQKADKWFNFWQKTNNADGETNPSGTAGTYWLLILTCSSSTIASQTLSTFCSQIKPAVVATDNTAVYPGVMVPQVSFVTTFKGNPLYPSNSEFDFIVCFRALPRAPASQPANQAAYTFPFTNVSLGKLSSSGVLHAQTFMGGLNAETNFRISFVLASQTTASVWNTQVFAPMLLRVGGIINTADLNSQTSNVIAIFLDSGVSFIDTVVSDGSTRTTGSASSFTSQIITSGEGWSAHSANGFVAYYPIMTRIVLSAGASAGADFNYYAIVQGTGFDTVHTISLALASTTSVSNYGSGPTFSVYGLQWQKDLVLFTGDATLTTSGWVQGTAGQAASFIPDGTQMDGATCSQTPNFMTDTATPVTTLYGGLAITNAIVKMNTLGCAPGSSFTFTANYRGYTAAAGTSNSQRVGATYWGLHFIVAQTGTRKYWEGSTITSSLIHTAAPATACYELNYKLASGDTSRTRYIIICPGDDVNSGTQVDLTAASNYIQMSKLTIPIYYGAVKYSDLSALTAQLKPIMGYILTGNNGLPFDINQQPGDVLSMAAAVSATLACTVANNTGVMNVNKTAQKVAFIFNPKQSFDLKYSATQNTNQFVVKQTIAGASSQTSIDTNCVSSGSLTCSLSNSGLVNTFTLTGPTSTSTVLTQTVSSGDITINFWMNDANSDSTTITGVTHTAIIYLFNPDVTSAGYLQEFSVCASSTWLAAGTSTNTLTLNNAVITRPYVSARTSFSITWSIQKTFWSFSKFTLSLGAYATGLTSANAENKRCRMFYGSDLSFDFATVTNDLSGTINIVPKSTASFTYSKTSFTLKCNGVNNPSATASADMSCQHIVNALTIVDSGTKTQVLGLQTVTAPTNVVLAATLLQKQWTDAGVCTPYIFNVKNTGTGSIAAGYYVIVEFSAQAPPKLNTKGALYCEISSNVTSSEAFCEFENDKRVKIFGSLDLTNRVDGFNFTIFCLNNPNALDSLKTVYLSIENEAGNILFQTVPGLTDTDVVSSVEVAIPILDFQMSKNATRSTTNFQYDISLTTAQVAKDLEMWVQFEGDFWQNFKSGFNPSCTMQRLVTPPQVLTQSSTVDYTTDSTVSNFVNCTYFKSNKVKLYIQSTDAKNTDSSIYRLSINNVPTPWKQNDISNQIAPPVLMFAVTAAATGVVSLTSRSGSMNNSMQGFAKPSDIKLEWNNPVIAYIGVYNNAVAKTKLKPVEDQYNLAMVQFSEDLTFTAPTQTAFSFSTTTFAVKQGDTSLSFVIAPKASTAPGLYYLAFVPVSAKNSTYAPFKPLQVVAKNLQCNIDALSSYSFPAAQAAVDGTAAATSGQSLPYAIDLSACLPETAVSLKIAAQLKNGSAVSSDGLTLYNGYSSSFGYAVINSSFAGVNFTFNDDTTQVTKSLVAGGSDTGITFQIKGASTFSLNNAEVSREMGKLLFVWDNSTANYKSYAQILAGSNGFATVFAVAAPTTASKITISNKDAPTKTGGSITFNVACDLPASIYWIASRNNGTVEQATFSNIKAQSYTKNLKMTTPSGVDATVQGYALALTASTAISITVTPTRANAFYKFSAFCVNTLENVDNATSRDTIYFQAADNGGKPGIAKVTYKKDLSTDEKNKGCKAFASFSQVPCKRTMCTTGQDACGLKFDPYGDFTVATTSTTTSTTTTTTTSTNTTNTNTTTNASANTTHRRRVLQNTTATTTTAAYTGNCSTNCSACTSATNCTTCATGFIVDSDLSCKNATSPGCSTGYIADSTGKVCVKLVQTIEVYSVSPDVFAASDNTVTLVTAAITNKAQLLQAIATATGISSTLMAAELVDISSIGSGSQTINATKNGTTQTTMTCSFTLGIPGFIIAGYSNANSSVTTIANLKLGTTTTGNLQGLFVQYAEANKAFLQTWSSLSSGTTYKVWYGATDLDLVNGKTSALASLDVPTSGTSTTTTTPSGSMRVATTFFALLALLFVAFIMI